MRVALFGAFGIGNLGNDASARAMIALLRSRDPSAEIAALSRGAAPPDLLGVPVIGFTRPSRGRAGRVLGKLGDLRRLLGLVRRFDLVVVPGTGLLEEPHRRLPGGELTWLLSVTLACALRRVPIAWFALGGARSMPVVPRLLTRAAVRAAGHASFRDRMTADSLGRGGRRIVVPDVVFAHGGDIAPRAGGAPTVAVAVIDYDPGDDATRSRYFAELGAALDDAVGEGWAVRFVVGDDADEPHAAAVRAALARRHPDAELPEVAASGDLDALLAEFAAVDVVVASRYHVLLAAALAARPAVALSHADKDEALMTDLGMAGLLLSAATFTAAELAARVRRCLDEATGIGAALAERVETAAVAVVSGFERSGIATTEGLRR